LTVGVAIGRAGAGFETAETSGIEGIQKYGYTVPRGDINHIVEPLEISRIGRINISS